MSAFVRVEQVAGGHAVFCSLCGKRAFKAQQFLASDTNYAEALRLATAAAWQHEHGDMHAAALAAFHDTPPPPTDEEALLGRIFGTKPSSERERRRAAAKSAARSWASRRQAKTRRQDS